MLISDFATAEGINLAKASIELLKSRNDSIRISFVSSAEAVVSKRIFCKSMEEPQLSSLSEIFDSLSIPVQEEKLFTTSKDCDSEFQIYASVMHELVKELDLGAGQTYVMFNGRVITK
jgi:hypothetical protein